MAGLLRFYHRRDEQLKYFLTGLLILMASLASGGGASAQGAVSVGPADSQVFARRAIESVSGQLADLQLDGLGGCGDGRARRHCIAEPARHL